ncbi:MAG: ABC transporter permease subunit [Planctomycetota bacterium]|jgi:phosphate transport system permease protein
MAQNSFTGHRRQRKTPKSVARAERTAQVLIYAGGFGTIVAIGLIFFFLVSVVTPLFGGADAGQERVVAKAQAAGLIGTGCDEYRTITWTLFEDGTLQTRQFRTGEEIATEKLLGDSKPTAFKSTPDGSRWIFGFADGTIRLLNIAFEIGFKELPEVSEEVAALEVGAQGVFGEDGMVEKTPERQFRTVRLVPEVGAPVKTTKGSILAVDLSFPPSGRALAALSQDAELVVATIDKRLNMMTGEEEERAKTRPLPYSAPNGRGFPEHVALTGSANELFLVWEDGYCIRYDSRSLADDGGPIPEAERQAEKLTLIGHGTQVSRLEFLNGKSTLLVGDTGGIIHLWSPTRPDDPTSIDGIEMRKLRQLEGPRSAVTSIASSGRSRLMLAGYENGEVRVFQATRGADLGTMPGESTTAVAAVTFAPKEDAVLSAAGGTLREWEFDPGYHDVSMATMFLKVWYERQAEPIHEWQSTGGDDAEPKIGLYPLIFGTLKATFYSMLMAIPIALLAAVYTSEFMKPSVRAPVKSVIEMMASLPSVVLGFLAALVVAPFVAGVLPATLAALLTIPFAYVLGARLWQMLPAQKALTWGGAPKFVFMSLMLPLGILMAVALGPATESIFYGGDIKAWLNAGPDTGGAIGGWMFILLPLSAMILAFAWSRWGAPWLRGKSFDWDRGQCARFDIGRLFALIIASFVLAAILGWALSMFGLDPRTDFMGQYSPRNALIVGFAMGFAIVPIIYTLAEDALSGVPSQLREGSLGAGATPWQTAVRIIIPTAMSGIFGAIMVGLGRAVGETMIVLMAAGNTAIMEVDAFSGFRALSANIATELPEAPRGGSHYRVLFFSALVLFAMTFVINTLAEMVRRRFRARYSEQL